MMNKPMVEPIFNELGSRICFYDHETFENDMQSTNYHRYRGCCQKHANFRNRLKKCIESDNIILREVGYYAKKQVEAQKASPKTMYDLLKLVTRQEEKVSDFVSVIIGKQI